LPTLHLNRSRTPWRVADFSCIRLVTSLSLWLIASTCYAQSPADPAASAAISPSVYRRVELLIRSQFSVPSRYEIVFGEKTKSDIPGYDTLPVTFINGGKQTVATFLISKDCNTLARLEKFDISKDPALIIRVDGRPIRGDDAAKVEIINFDDLECPYCAQLNSELSTQTLDHYKGLIKIVYKDYPIEELHPWAMHAAVDANCLADLNSKAYWAYVDFVHAHGRDISGAQFEPAKSFLALDHIASTFGAENKVDEAKLGICLKQQDASAVKSSVKSAASLGIDATPQMFVNGERLQSGARPVDELWPAIDRALKAQGIQPPPK
jgi:protein-disulfide isomerase